MKKRTWIFLIFYILAVLSPVTGFAQSVPIQPVTPPLTPGLPMQPITPAVPATPANQEAPGALSLTPPDTDLSVGYLSNIFGTVDGVLAGTGSQLLGSLFGIFNGAVLVLGGIVILYTLFVSTIKTAHEGEVLGKQWSSVWIPLRSVISIALLIPKASGYSFIQIFMMWVVVMGVGAADSVWNSALNYFLRGGILMQQNTAIGGTAGGPKLISSSGTLLQMLTCTQMLQNQLTAYRAEQLKKEVATPIPPVPNFYQGIQTAINTQLSSASAMVTFPMSGYTVGGAPTDGICGYMTWSAPSTSTAGLTPATAQQIQQSRSFAVQAMVTQLYGAARQVVDNDLVVDPTNNRYELGHILNPGVTPLIWGAGTLQKPTSPLLPGSILSNAAATYLGIMAPTLNYIQNYQNIQNQAGKWIATAQGQGWIIAGSYYFQIIQLNKGVTISEANPPTFNSTNLTNLPTTLAPLFVGGTYAQTIIDLVNGKENYQIGTGSKFMNDAPTYGNSLTYGQIGNAPSSGSVENGSGAAGQLLAVFTAGIGNMVDGFGQLFNSQQSTGNPILALAELGSGMVNLSVNVFITLAFIAFGVAFGLGWAWGFTFVVAVIAVMMPILALFTPVFLALLVSGLMMSLYLPLIPYIIFTFGAIGWFIAVIEAIIAAPLVALGIAHPEGQEILGKAEPAVGLLVNVFLRPTFMIFGLLIGMMLAYVGIWLLNVGFGGVFAQVRSAALGWAWMFSLLGMYVIYVLIVMQIVQKSFTLIYIIPDEVLKWIGVNIKGMGGEAEAERAIHGGAQSAAETGGKMVSGAPEAAHGAMKAGDKASRIKDKAEASKEADIAGPKPPGGGGGGANPPAPTIPPSGMSGGGNGGTGNNTPTSTGSGGQTNS